MIQRVTLGVHHIGLAVPDLAAAATFFIEALGFEKAGEVADYAAVFVSDGSILITLWQVTDPATATPFDRRANVGLHHIALKVADDEALYALHDKLAKWPGCSIEVSPCPIREGSHVRHFIGAMPGGIRVEFATPFPG
jgi:catechol 2,3-dioxygenase-like lactoylglutathione lyase family enzyme